MRKGISSLIAAAFAWSWPNVMIRMLRTDFDVFTQSFFRYFAACIFLFTIGLIFTRRKIIEAFSNFRILMIPALIMAVHQIFFTAGIFMTSAVFSSLMGRLNAVIIPALSYVFYEDERRIVGNRNFLLGALIAFAGVVGVILGGKSSNGNGSNLGVVFVFMGTVGWSVYAVSIKKVVRTVDPIAIIAFVSLISIIIFLPVALIFGDIRDILGSHGVRSVTTGKWMLLFGSGILGVGIGNIFYYHAIKHVGTSVASVFFLLLPLSIGLVAFLVLKETLTIVQILSGAVLTFGCWVVTKLAKRTNTGG